MELLFSSNVKYVKLHRMYLAGSNETRLHESLAERERHLSAAQEPDPALHLDHVGAPRRRRHRGVHLGCKSLLDQPFDGIEKALGED